MEKFVDGEPWKVEWGELDKGVMDKLFSKMVNVSVFCHAVFFCLSQHLIIFCLAREIANLLNATSAWTEFRSLAVRHRSILRSNSYNCYHKLDIVMPCTIHPFIENCARSTV
ncbi:hypothetical protein BC943DRAFT_322025, partial [Umbelopsis sp. AD052]